MTNETLESLVRELIDNEPMETCADHGTSCVFCGAEWSQALAWRGLDACDHHKDCWIVRASRVLDGVE